MKMVHCHYKAWFFSLLSLLVLGCGQEEKIPQEKFIEIIIDMLKYSKASQHTISDLNLTAASIDSLENTVAQSILDTHQVTREQLITTLRYYDTHTTEFLKLLSLLKTNALMVNEPQVAESEQ